MMEQRQKQLLASGQVVAPASTKVYSPWKAEKASTQPRFKLPPPPHPLPESVASPAGKMSSNAKNLRDIMAEESKNTKAPVKAKPSPPKSMKTALQLPKGSAPPMQSPPWALPVAATPVAPPAATPKAAYSLGDFLKPKPRAVKTGHVGWTSPKASPAQSSPSAASLVDIQLQEHDFKTKQDQTYSDNGSWFIERRERAGSFKEIQTDTAAQLEERRFIEEQIRIEQEIQHEFAAGKAKEEAAARGRPNKGKSKKTKPQGGKGKSPGPGQGKSPSDGTVSGKKDQTKARRRKNSNAGNNRGTEAKPKKKVANQNAS